MSIFDTINQKLNDFTPISLKEMGVVKLMNRVDTKFVASTKQLIPFLAMIEDDYLVQEIQGRRISGYKTLYFDTPEHTMYLIHQNGRAIREKIRMREYIGSDLVFLEVKDKNNRGRTKKVRIELPQWGDYQSDECSEFLGQRAKFELEHIQPHLQNTFQRITLVNKQRTERLTIDLALSFYNLEINTEIDMSGIMVIELKQDGYSMSHSRKVLRNLRILPMGFSKYCIGCALTNPQLKQNNFKDRLRAINRIEKLTL